MLARRRPHTLRPPSVAGLRALRSTPPAQIGPLLAGLGVAGVLYGTRLLLQAAQNPKFQEAMRRGGGGDGSPDGDPKREPDPSRGRTDSGEPAPRRTAEQPSYFTTEAMGCSLGEGSKDWSGACAAVFEGGAPRVVENENGGRVTPSVVAFADDGEALVGLTAKKLLFSSRATAVYGHQLLLGRAFESRETEALLAATKATPFDVVPDERGLAAVRVHGVLHPPAELAARTLAALKESAERVAGRSVTVAVAGVPAPVDEPLRAAMAAVARRAGVQRLELVPSAVAAALAAEDEFPDELASAGTLGVLEMSGLSSSLTVLAKRPEGAEGGGGGWVWEVAASHRQHGVGGESLDGALVEHLVRGFREAHGIDLSADHLALVRLHEASEAAILALCSSPSVPVSLPFITADASGPKHLEQTLSRAALERLIEPALAAAIDALPAALADASPAPQGVDQLLLAGGAARLDAVGERVGRALGRAPLRPARPEESVAVGATIYARRLQEREFGGA